MRLALTSEARAAVIAGVRAGLSIEAASRNAGVSTKTVRNWLAMGRAESFGERAAFAAAVDEARTAAQAEEVGGAEFRRQLAAAVRGGSVSALRLWWTAYGGDERDRPPDGVDRLAARRAARLASMNGNGTSIEEET